MPPPELAVRLRIVLASAAFLIAAASGAPAAAAQTPADSALLVQAVTQGLNDSFVRQPGGIATPVSSSP
jgi:hypothetical protein